MISTGQPGSSQEWVLHLLYAEDSENTAVEPSSESLSPPVSSLSPSKPIPSSQRLQQLFQVRLILFQLKPFHWNLMLVRGLLTFDWSEIQNLHLCTRLTPNLRTLELADWWSRENIFQAPIISRLLLWTCFSLTQHGFQPTFHQLHKVYQIVNGKSWINYVLNYDPSVYASLWDTRIWLCVLLLLQATSPPQPPLPRHQRGRAAPLALPSSGWWSSLPS